MIYIGFVSSIFHISRARISLDINLARTFLEIASSHSFVQAAERLHITQTAVSARIKTLEALQLSYPFTFKVEQDRIVISK